MTARQPHCPDPTRPLVLASSSPRRRDLLRNLGLRFEIASADVAEQLTSGEPIEAAVSRLAAAKANAAAPYTSDALVIAADTLVELEGRILGKPLDADDAHRMLSELSGHRHRVVTALVLLDSASGETQTRLVETFVTFRRLQPAEIDAYVATGEPLDKAGAYGMQDLGAVFVELIEGDYYNVVGLPLVALNELLTKAGGCILCRSLAARSD